jgi:hypothetical protein
MLTAIVILVLLYVSTLLSGGGMRMLQGFADLGETTNTFTLYYMTGCPHCEDPSWRPDFNKFVGQGELRENNKVTKIFALEQSTAQAQANFASLKAKGINVSGFPTFVMETTNGNAIEYSGGRSVDEMKAFIKANAV